MDSSQSSQGPSNPRKSNAYSKRHSTSIPAPIEFDSDSDFAPGAFVEEVKAKPKKKTKTVAASARKKALEITKKRNLLSKKSTSKETRKRVLASNPNPLLEYFGGNNLELESASEDGDEEEDFPEEEEDDDDRSPRSGSDSDEPRYIKRAPRPSQPPPAKQPKANQPIGTQAKPIVIDIDNSDTESDSDEPPPPRPKRKSSSPLTRPAKRLKLATPPEDDSATESGTDEEIFPLTSAVKPLPEDDSATESGTDDEENPPASVKPPPEDDSATEEDPDYDEMLNAMDDELKPKPGFPLALGQEMQLPLVLDREQGIKVPTTINTYLRPYQRDGVEFFWRQYKEAKGGLLGDDMGLVRKTIQVISFLSAIMKKEGLETDKDRRKEYVSKLQDGESWRRRRRLPPANAKWPTCLIIAPSSVVSNWEREFQTWGYFEVGMYIGTQKEREPVLHDFKLGRLDVVITSFDLARRDIEVLDDLPWSCIIIDEVHRVKNERSKITHAFHQFACNIRFGLTGTTIQNSYKEMWTILDWTNPGKLGTSRQWQGYVVKPLTVGQSASASEDQRAQALMVALVLRDKLLPNFFLRRTKDIIKDQLPKKLDQVVFCPLAPTQIAVYKNILNTAAVQNLIRKEEKCDCGSMKIRKSCCYPFVAGDVFKFMSILIKLSNHLGLILPGSPKDSADQTARNRALAEIAFPNGNVPKYGTAILQPSYCGKWTALETLLQVWRKDTTNKVLIFTKSVKLLEMLEFHLNTKGYGFLKLDGSTKQSDRMPMIDQFHTDPNVFIFLISTLAGGTGLNLTGANKVVIFDPNWNPAHDLQAMDRAFRFGQTRDVTVLRLLGAGSVEELIYARQIYKQQQMAIGYDASMQTRYFEGVQGDASRRGELFGIENIFKLHEDKLATKIAIEKANLAELDWALANISRQRKKKLPKTTSELLEAETKAISKEDAGLRGLGALLFDDAVPVTKETEEDAIKRTLSAIGVRYSHKNDDILVPSRIEEERTKQTIMKRRKDKGKQAKSKEEEKPVPVWPPIGRHRKRNTPPEPTPEEQLNARRDALIALGYIDGREGVAGFAARFVRETAEEQKAILEKLDEVLMRKSDET